MPQVWRLGFHSPSLLRLRASCGHCLCRTKHLQCRSLKQRPSVGSQLALSWARQDGLSAPHGIGWDSGLPRGLSRLGAPLMLPVGLSRQLRGLPRKHGVGFGREGMEAACSLKDQVQSGTLPLRPRSSPHSRC